LIPSPGYSTAQITGPELAVVSCLAKLKVLVEEIREKDAARAESGGWGKSRANIVDRITIEFLF
jgi:hypothetical protein